jgi:hypothetical protein
VDHQQRPVVALDLLEPMQGEQDLCGQRALVLVGCDEVQVPLQPIQQAILADGEEDLLPPAPAAVRVGLLVSRVKLFHVLEAGSAQNCSVLLFYSNGRTLEEHPVDRVLPQSRERVALLHEPVDLGSLGKLALSVLLAAQPRDPGLEAPLLAELRSQLALLWLDKVELLKLVV